MVFQLEPEASVDGFGGLARGGSVSERGSMRNTRLVAKAGMHGGWENAAPIPISYTMQIGSNGREGAAA